MDQDWFEMQKLQKRRLDRAVWIPLYAEQTVFVHGIAGQLGFCEEYFGAGSLAISIQQESEIDDLGSLRLYDHSCGPYIENSIYIESDKYVWNINKCFGQYLVLVQRFEGEENPEWHLHQDLVLALKLKRENDSWIKPDEGYVEVVRIKRHENDSPALIEIKAEFLRDYLSAKDMLLLVSSYRSRIEIVNKYEHIKWNESKNQIEEENLQWEGRITPIHEGGMPYNEEMLIIHASRIDVDQEEDIPYVGTPKDNDIKSTQWLGKSKGKKIFRIHGELWKDEKIYPGEYSVRVRGDKTPPTVFFITDAKGTKESRETLANPPIYELKYLWFKPEVILKLAHQRGGSLRWCTRNTGHVSCSPGTGTHFGVNELGLINVLAKDIAQLPDWQQQIWAGYNISPEGGLSKELQLSQIRADPARTEAPERSIYYIYKRLNIISKGVLSEAIFMDHEQTHDLFEKCHRFRAVDYDGFLALAKDLTRLIIESIDSKLLKKHLNLSKKENLGSLKLLEKCLAKVNAKCNAYGVLTPLHGIYNLRQADSHLRSSQFEKALDQLGISKDDILINKATLMIEKCALTLIEIAKIFAGKYK